MRSLNKKEVSNWEDNVEPFLLSGVLNLIENLIDKITNVYYLNSL